MFWLHTILVMKFRCIGGQIKVHKGSNETAHRGFKPIIFLLYWFDFTPMVEFLPCLQHVCSLPAA